MPSQVAPAVIERRDLARRPARLVALRLVDWRGRFLCEAPVINMSMSGARLRLAREAVAPAQALAFDETRMLAAPARLAWRAGAAAGYALGVWRPLEALPGDLARALRAAYYAAD